MVWVQVRRTWGSCSCLRRVSRVTGSGYDDHDGVRGGIRYFVMGVTLFTNGAGFDGGMHVLNSYEIAVSRWCSGWCQRCNDAPTPILFMLIFVQCVLLPSQEVFSPPYFSSPKRCWLPLVLPTRSRLDGLVFGVVVRAAGEYARLNAITGARQSRSGRQRASDHRNTLPLCSFLSFFQPPKWRQSIRDLNILERLVPPGLATCPGSLTQLTVVNGEHLP